MGNLENMRPFPKFFYTLGMLPTSFKISLTYEEQMEEVMNFIKTEIIPHVNDNTQAIKDLVVYVNEYFENLDLTEEISQKLDEMAEDGTLTTLITNYVNPLIQAQNERITESITSQNANIETQRQQLNQSISEQNSEIDTQNLRILNVENKVNAVTNFAPIPVTTTADMTDTSKLYLLTTDGNWYYYDGTNWTSGGTYQTAENSSQVNQNTQDLTDITYIKTYNIYGIGNLPHTYELVNTTTTLIQRTNINFEQAPAYYNFKANKYYFMWCKVKRNAEDTVTQGLMYVNPYQQSAQGSTINATWYDRATQNYGGMEAGKYYELSIGFKPTADVNGFMKFVAQNMASTSKNINITFSESGILEFNSEAELTEFLKYKKFVTQRGFVVVDDKIGNDNYSTLKAQVDSIEVPTYDTDIIFWGDSLTHGMSNANFPTICANLLNKEFLNYGIGGETAYTICARQGSVTAVVPANADPSSFTLADINGHAINPLLQVTIYGNAYVNPVTIDGDSTEYTLSRNQDGTYAIANLTQAPYPRYIKFASASTKGAITVLFMGTNGPTSAELIDLLNQTTKGIENQKFVVMGYSFGTTASRQAVTTEMYKYFGNKFFDTGEMVSKYGMAIMNLSPTAEDNLAIANGQIPPSLMADNVHLNANGYTALGTLLANFIANLYL